MQTFIIVWLGQTASLIGSSMTSFAFTIWVWKLTGKATALALFGFFIQVPQVLIAPFAGAIVDRCHRKTLMMVGDTMSGLLTFTVLLLYSTHKLVLWHLYVVVAIMGIFAQLQELAYSASISMLVPKQHYSRASSIGFLAIYSSSIIAPALAGALYPVIGLVGIMAIDIATFVLAMGTMLLVHIPQPTISKEENFSRKNIQQDIFFGIRYIFARPSLLALMISASLFWFANDLCDSLYSPLILARSGGNARLLGVLASAAGIGGVVGALLVSSWGGSGRRIHGVLLGMVGVGLCKMLFAVSRTPLIWAVTKFCSSLNFPLIGSSSDAIWLSKVKPDVQGRVFAARQMVVQVTSAIAFLIAGPLADCVFEPAMMPKGSLAPVFGPVVGTGRGAGIALLYASCALCSLLVGIFGYLWRALREVEVSLPDHDVE